MVQDVNRPRASLRRDVELILNLLPGRVVQALGEAERDRRGRQVISLNPFGSYRGSFSALLQQAPMEVLRYRALGAR